MRKFKIPSPPSSTTKSIRFPNTVIGEVEEAIQGTDCTCNAWVGEAGRVALEHLRDDQLPVRRYSGHRLRLRLHQVCPHQGEAGPAGEPLHVALPGAAAGGGNYP